MGPQKLFCKEAMDLKAIREGVCGRVWREERAKRHTIITMQFQE